MLLNKLLLVGVEVGEVVRLHRGLSGCIRVIMWRREGGHGVGCWSVGP